MRSQAILGVVLIIAGIVILYVLRDLLMKLIVLLLGVLGIGIAFLLIAVGFGILFWRRPIIRLTYRTD